METLVSETIKLVRISKMEISKESMISRQLLLESEIDKLKHECAKMYFEYG